MILGRVLASHMHGAQTDSQHHIVWVWWPTCRVPELKNTESIGRKILPQPTWLRDYPNWSNRKQRDDNQTCTRTRIKFAMDFGGDSSTVI